MIQMKKKYLALEGHKRSYPDQELCPESIMVYLIMLIIQIESSTKMYTPFLIGLN